MGVERQWVTSLHRATKRDYLARMTGDKVKCMKAAKQYAFDYWDGDRRFGYGGYKYIPGRWKPVAEALLQMYNLKAGSRVLDVGCGKGFLLHEILLLEPELQVVGFDVSEYGISQATDLVRAHLFQRSASEAFLFENKHFDLVISLAALHNLNLQGLSNALSEIERVGKQAYVMTESYRNEEELFNLECWALTCQTFFSREDWLWAFDHFGYRGDYEFIYFE